MPNSATFRRRRNSKLELYYGTGSSVTLISDSDFKSLNAKVTLTAPTVNLLGYSVSSIHCLGESIMNLQTAEQNANILVRVVKNGRWILGRDALHKIKLPWNDIFTVHAENEFSFLELKKRYAKLFRPGLGKVRDVKVKLHIKADSPVHMKPRALPFSLREEVECAFNKLEKEDIIERVNFSSWAPPIVPVRKSNGDIRICGDYSETINKYSVMQTYPLPTITEPLSNLQGGKYFTKIDMSQAYHQLELDEDSKEFTCITASQGLYVYKRLMFGINTAVAIFQRTMENLLKGMPGCAVYIDDILITGSSEREH